MPNIRCPMCSQFNPPDSETCAYCGARLKPLKPSTPEGEVPNSPQGEEEPDWLRSLRSDESGPLQSDQPDEPAPEQGSEELDWLSRIRARAQSELGGAPEGKEEQEPDWLRDLSGENPSEAATEPEQAQPGQGAASSAEPAGEDWANQLSSWQPSGGETPPTSGENPPAGQELSPEPGQWEEGSGFGLTGFLSSLREGGEGEMTPSEPPAEEPVESLEGPTEPAEEQAAQPEESFPDWLGGGGAGEPPETGETGLPDWLDTLAVETPPLPSQEEPEAAAPAWEGVGSGDAIGEPGAEEGLELPGWLSEFKEEPVPQETGEEPAVEAEEAGPLADAGLPGWAGSTDQEQAGQPAAGQEPAETAQADQPPPSEQPVEAGPAAGETQPAAAPSEAIPDWLKEFEAQPPSGPFVPPLIEGEEGPAVVEGTGEEQPFRVDLPDWLGDEQAEVEEAGKPAEPAGEPLAQAELPEWVKEMRPIESIIPAEAQIPETERRAEKSGPLAGMTGVLPVEEAVTRYRKPPVYTVRLHVTEKQRSQASQFDSLLAQETQPLLIPLKGRRGQGLVLRILVSILLIAVLSAARLLQLEPLGIPALRPVESDNMYQQINRLAPGAPVLLAVDYEPGLSGEMKLAALPVIEHLMQQKAHVVVISTRPNGPALAEMLLKQAAEDARANNVTYDVSQNVVNLGYLPGDMISLLEFARQPAFAAPGDLRGELAWGQPLLKGITGMQDFSAVVVLTDAAETGRSWVEQVQTQMGQVPLLMVVSAQAAPMMAPFVESDQVKGMVSGLLGGYQYAVEAQQPQNPVQGYLASFQLGMLLAFVLALVGGLVSGGIALFKRSNRDEE